ncbi:hypothetical protein ACFQ07_01560 [Actinomadura adrarensis]|uniref:SMP-30/gluconolactonase/LRE family protein n=1 Tax=Actinomadura adrarensis TaxID=1819600 RepID=A0ABW3C8R8_9ACTN
MQFEVQLIAVARTTIGENPLWDAIQERLYWIDAAEGPIFRSTADGKDTNRDNRPA